MDTLQSGSTMMAAAGSAVHQPSRYVSASVVSTCPSTAASGWVTDSAAYTARLTAYGSQPVRCIRRRFRSSAVPVAAATSAALEEAGEHRSPK